MIYGILLSKSLFFKIFYVHKNKIALAWQNLINEEGPYFFIPFNFNESLILYSPDIN